VKSVSFFLEQFQRYGLLKNVQRFGATLYDCNTRPFITPVKDINANTQKKEERTPHCSMVSSVGDLV